MVTKRLIAMGVGLLLTVLLVQVGRADERARGRRIATGSRPSSSYSNSWALIIGINYQDRLFTQTKDKFALPPLKNAEEDANAIYQLLVEHYGYREESAESDGNIVKLVGKEATDDAINREIGRLIDSQRVGADDSVLVFFAGHGFKLNEGKRDRAAILPYDVSLSGGQPIDNYLRLQSDVFEKLSTSRAKHKLVILDSCYSGEILKSGFHPPTERDDRSTLERFDFPVFEAIASCRAYQVASDGSSINSPFTSSLKKALETLPARESYTNGLWTSRLFSYLHPEMKGRTNGQEPQFGILEGDGEFRFFPDTDAESLSYFEKNQPKLSTYKLLQASVTSTEGAWWFEEMPWFVPGLRKAILDSVSGERSSASAFIKRDELKRLARGIISDAERKASDDGALQTDATGQFNSHKLFQLRCKHANLLLQSEGTNQFSTALEKIANELENQEHLEPVDIHFAAVLKSELNDPRANIEFERAINAYCGSKGLEASELLSDVDRAMLAICLADFGQHLYSTKLYEESAERFRIADRTFGINAPAAFRIFVLCREAEAWMKLNRWVEANEQLDLARNVAEVFDAEHLLTAHVYRRLAWSRMVQWKIENAEHWFVKSNRVLSSVFDRETSTSALAADEAPTLQPKTEVLTSERAGKDSRFRIDESFSTWESYDAKIAFLHNLHGLAMVQRFKGNTNFSAEKYRWLARQVESALTHLRSIASKVEGDAEHKLYDRLVNTLERLGDCNLFGDPKHRDLTEAADDYRRALSRCHRMTLRDRDSTRANLLFKQALALALPSPIQDTKLALATCQAADQIHSRLYEVSQGLSDQDSHSGTGKPAATGMALALGELTTKTVSLVHVSQQRESASVEELKTVIAGLRAAIFHFRNENGPNFHRDQLEICLLASKVLLDHGCIEDRFNTYEDAELLLSLCRTALAPFQVEEYESEAEGYFGEIRGYLRPYYDTVARNKIRIAGDAPSHVKDLFEIQREATQGRVYMKPSEIRPTLAIYILDDSCLLLLDLPGGPSRSYTLSDDFDSAEIQQAIYANPPRLDLPREVKRAMSQWRDALVRETPVIPEMLVECLWEDLAPANEILPTESNVGQQIRAKPAVGQFPFRLPEGFKLR
ncbi:MAG: caspase domain-containing protein [Pirellulaceae bacterium]